jgi:hypothetical protein
MENLKKFENFYNQDDEWNARVKAELQEDAATNPGLVDALEEYKDAAIALIEVSKKLDTFKKESNDGDLSNKISHTQKRANDVLRIFDNHFGDIIQ